MFRGEPWMTKPVSTELKGTQEEIDTLLSTQTVRARSKKLFDHCESGKGHFSIHLDRMDECVKLVCEVIEENYPSLEIPYHARWEHFQTPELDRKKRIPKRD